MYMVLFNILSNCTWIYSYYLPNIHYLRWSSWDNHWRHAWWCCGVRVSLTRGKQAHSTDASKWFSTVHVDTPEITFALNCTMDAMQSIIASIWMHWFCQASVLCGGPKLVYGFSNFHLTTASSTVDSCLQQFSKMTIQPLKGSKSDLTLSNIEYYWKKGGTSLWYAILPYQTLLQDALISKAHDTLLWLKSLKPLPEYLLYLLPSLSIVTSIKIKHHSSECCNFSFY